MALDNNQFDGHRDIAQFLEKFREKHSSEEVADERDAAQQDKLVSSSRQNRSFERLEEKIRELEERFEVSAAQNHLILSELARTREAMEYQESRNSFIDGLAKTIESLKSSVETLSKAQMGRPLGFTEPEVNRPFDRAALPSSSGGAHTAVYQYGPGDLTLSSRGGRAGQEEKERIISSLRQKASQLKAVNLALDREIKKAQQEKMDALKKSAEQAKEILSLRDQLTAAEERFKSFDFEGRIISVKQEYQQKVTVLEEQLREISNTCMKQVEEIESLKAENLKLHLASKEKEEVLARFEAKSREVEALQQTLQTLRAEKSADAAHMQELSARLHALEEERDALGRRLEQAQASLDGVLLEKQTLERNFKELLSKIESNDSVIEELKRKIDILTAENTQLSQDNAALAQAKETLNRENAALMQKNRELGVEALRLSQDREEILRAAQALRKEKDALSGAHAALTEENSNLLSGREEALRAAREEKARLSAENQTLLQEKRQLDARARALDEEKDRLAQENDSLLKEKEMWRARQERLSLEKSAALREKEDLKKENTELRSQSAALLAVRLADKKREESLKRTAQEPNTVPAAPQVPPAPVQAAAPVVSAPASFETPVQMQQTVRSSVITEADLPEIRVAKPVPVQDEPFNGEDFLEKTDSFIGRMKWSLFREDR